MKKQDERKKYAGREENLVSLADRPVEERKAIARKSVETRRKNKEKRMMLQECMKQLLNMPVKTPAQRRILESFGFEGKDLKNKTVLMVALFQKGLTGDVPAIREIVNMMDKLQMFEDSGTVGTSVTINVLPVGSDFKISNEDEELIRRAEAGEQSIDLEKDPTEDWNMEEEEDWGNDVYDPS